MGKYWDPSGKIVDIRAERRTRGTRASEYLVLWVLGAVIVGFLAAAVIGWSLRSAEVMTPAAPIEWNAVQALPTRAPDPADVAWEKRATEADSPSTGSGRAQGDEAGTIDIVRGHADESSTGSPQKIYAIDGDTFGFGVQRIRILGMDAPETHPPRCIREAQLGLAATAKLKELLSSGTVTMSGSGHDQYGRELRQVFVNGQDVADAMIGAGLARSYSGGKRQGWC